MQFRDKKDLLWRVDLQLKNAADSASPLMLTYGGGTPISITWDGDENDQFKPIISSKAELVYYYTGSDMPDPETFIDIEEDQWLMVVSKLPDNTTPVLYWKGFVTPSSNRYPWLAPPFTYTINAVDFSFSKGKYVDLNKNGLFLYDFVTLGELLKRALFASVGYEDSILSILFNIKPAAIGTGRVTDSLYAHTDSVFDFTDGAKFCYDALEQILSSTGSRMLYSSGKYWLQRFQDLNDEVQSITTITPDDTEGVDSINYDVQQPLGNSVSDTVIYLNKSQYLVVNPGLKKQTVNYDLKVINQVRNFDWRTDAEGPFDEWDGVNTDIYTRLGSGSVEDPYRLFVPGDLGQTMYQGIPVVPGKRIRVELKVKGYLTLPSPTTTEYQVSCKCVVTLVDPPTALIYGYTLGQDGKWNDYSTIGGFGEADYYFISTKGKGDSGTLEITSEPIPSALDSDNLEVRLYIIYSEVTPTNTDDPVAPGGTIYYTHFFPPYIGVYNDIYIKVKEDVVNSKTFSLKPDDKDRFYLDRSDDGLSNCLFYDDAGRKRALPQNDWNGRNIDEVVLRGELDQQYKAGYSFDGDVLSNELSFHHVITLTDKDAKKMMLIRDKYDIKACTHSIYATEIMPIGSGIGDYTLTPLAKKEED
ncbi:hypothetical protein [Chitinophaga pinensis]|nr:hypothetical protein [Chitinophaga pinensis]